MVSWGVSVGLSLKINVFWWRFSKLNRVLYIILLMILCFWVGVSRFFFSKVYKYLYLGVLIDVIEGILIVLRYLFVL